GQGRITSPAAAPELLAPTVPDRELPAELHAFLAELAAARLSPLARAQRVRDLVLTRYRYDLSYLQDERVARQLTRATAGSAHRHLAALHAGRDAGHLGAGVCHELNTLVCELLRRAGVPAALSTGWVLDRGHIDEPDHLWTLALLPSDQGPRWMPLDASLGRDGQPQVVPRRPAGDLRVTAPRPAAPLPAAPAWSRSSPARRSGPAPTAAHGAPASAPAAARGTPDAAPAAATATAPREAPPVTELVRAARYLARQQGPQLTRPRRGGRRPDSCPASA
ncbi:MAG: transglutaminase domain-containing protein, partial [Myxococcales bacterium]